MNAIWYFIIGAAASTFQPAQLGPMTQEQCEKVSSALPDVGSCRKAIGAMTCDAYGRPGSYKVCPLFEGDIPVSTHRQEGQ